MIKQVALLAPFALIVGAAACGSESPSATNDDETQATADDGQGDDVEDVGTVESDLRGGGGHMGGGHMGGGHMGGGHMGGGHMGGGHIGGHIGGGHVGGFGGGHVGGFGRGFHGGGFGPGFHGGGFGPGFHGGGVLHGGHFGHGAFSHRGWVNGAWAPGWGWAGTTWVINGVNQFACVVDTDCLDVIGADVAVCDLEPTLGYGQCVGVDW